VKVTLDPRPTVRFVGGVTMVGNDTTVSVAFELVTTPAGFVITSQYLPSSFVCGSTTNKVVFVAP
jgi:hypothetical protein